MPSGSSMDRAKNTDVNGRMSRFIAANLTCVCCDACLFRCVDRPVSSKKTVAGACHAIGLNCTCQRHGNSVKRGPAIQSVNGEWMNYPHASNHILCNDIAKARIPSESTIWTGRIIFAHSTACGPQANGTSVTPGSIGGAGSSRTLPVTLWSIAAAASLERCLEPPMLRT